MKKILITGANSYIGTSFADYMTRWNELYQIDTIDVKDEFWKHQDFSKYDSVFHVAGIAHSDSGKTNKEKEDLYYLINTNLTIDVARKAKDDGVKQFIFMSSAIVYGDSTPVGEEKTITKDTPLTPKNCYGDSKVQAEKGLQILEDEKFRVVIIRSPMIFGKGSKGNYLLLAKMARKVPIFPYVSNQRSMLYVGNLCEFVRLMIENDEQGIFWPQNREYSNTSEMIDMIARSHGKKMILLHGFEGLIKIASKKSSLVKKAFGNLCYEQQMSEYKEEYRLYSLKESIELTEL